MDRKVYRSCSGRCTAGLPSGNARLTTFAGIGGSGFHPAIALTCSRAFALSVMPRNRRRSSMAADSFSLLFEDGADRGGIGFSDQEHN
jgi:hypothetical protein